jgi:RNAse (barnase) inhibitor barstar
VTEHRIAGAAIHTKAQALKAIAKALAFPAYFGHNLDALYDCLTDLSWLPEGEHTLVWTDAAVLRAAEPETYAGIVSVLADAKAATAESDRRFSYRLA